MGRMNARTPVVTGMGGGSPLASNLRDHHARYLAGESGVVERAGDALAPRWAAAFDESMAQSIANRMLRKLLQRTAVMAVLAAGEATRDAGLHDDVETLAA